ncbi:MAG TPA: carboxypeptidase-like regulatory domain-containing protein [Terracidiphilus sp.]|nr:carboxypeptidase-like regulatory domain-containing protein [Terracidiphilus sp.]
MKLKATRLHWRIMRMAFMITGLFWFATANTAAQVDCISPKLLKVSRVQGQVFDITGAAVPGVVVSLVQDGKSTAQFHTGSNGEFQFKPAPGLYLLKAEVPAFQRASVELKVGRDLWNLLHPSTLRVIVGLYGSFCPWVTTSNREFQKMVRANNQRLKEHTETNATQR